MPVGGLGRIRERRQAARAAPAPRSAAPFTLGGLPCRLIQVPAADSQVPVGIGSCPGVRPGAEVQSEIGLCTFNFLFVTPAGERFIGTAGHCILGEGPVADNAGEKTWAKGAGPVAKDSTGKRIGEFAYAVLADPKDFALIRLDPGVEASPEMCNFGGPTGINDDIGDGPKVLQYFGNGIGIGIGSARPLRRGAGLPQRRPRLRRRLGPPRRLRQRRDHRRRPGSRRARHRRRSTASGSTRTASTSGPWASPGSCPR